MCLLSLPQEGTFLLQEVFALQKTSFTAAFLLQNKVPFLLEKDDLLCSNHHLLPAILVGFRLLWPISLL